MLDHLLGIDGFSLCKSIRSFAGAAPSPSFPLSIVWGGPTNVMLPDIRAVTMDWP